MLITPDNKIDISPIGSEANVIKFNDEYYEVGYLSCDEPSEGGNGMVFKILNNQTGDEFALKICKFHRGVTKDWQILKRKRFLREIQAFGIITQEDFENVVGFIGVGELKIKKNMYDYYVMDKCDFSLRKYLELQPGLSISQRISLFEKIVVGIKYLHYNGIYHRDIKNENILVLNGEPMICDLGLSDFRPLDVDIESNEVGEMIGPTGWFSPEATNKFLVEMTPNKYKFDCNIGAKSDVFQLGKLFWYIIQGNLPLGQINRSDLVASESNALYSAIRKCLSHSAARRHSIKTLKRSIEKMYQEFGL